LSFLQVDHNVLSFNVYKFNVYDCDIAKLGISTTKHIIPVTFQPQEASTPSDAVQHYLTKVQKMFYNTPLVAIFLFQCQGHEHPDYLINTKET
jgi:hypothetical protein